MVGPSAGATAITMLTKPIIAPRRSAGIRVMTVVKRSGIMMAVPIACTTRASSSTPKVGAAAASRVPRLKVPIARKNTARDVRR